MKSFVFVALLLLTDLAAIDALPPSDVLNDAENTISSHVEELNGMEAEGSISDAIKELRKLQELDPEEFDCDATTQYYTIDGLCNNLNHPTWGAAFMTYTRELPNSYQDGTDFPRVYHEGTRDPLPSARLLSTQCMPSLTEEKKRDLDKTHNQVLMQFGQFFAHDLAATGAVDAEDCCSGFNDNDFTSEGGACYPIPIPEDDRYFKDCMPFKRSISEPDTDGISQQLNSITSFVDLSAVYGSTLETANGLRSFTAGKLRLDKDLMLPQDNVHKCLLNDSRLEGCPHAGDLRVNVFPGLTSMHLVWHREHNRLAEKLAEVHPDWSDEKLFQEARRINIAQLQNVVYGEYLEAVLGRKVHNLFGFDQPASYNENVNPTIFNSFTTAAYRFGHSQINNEFYFGSDVPLKDTYFRPGFYCATGDISYSQIMQSLLKDKAQKVDVKFPEGVTDHLFLGVDAPGASTDLPARNIQRGRDHGLPPYDQYLDLALNFFGDPEYVKTIDWPACITGLYSSVRDVDLFVGGISEEHVPGGVVGPTFAYLIGLQFQNLRVGDRFFFDLQDSAAGFTEAQVESIKKTTLSGIICRNADLSRVQKAAFKVPSEKNSRRKCKDVPDVDFSLF